MVKKISLVTAVFLGSILNVSASAPQLAHDSMSNRIITILNAKLDSAQEACKRATDYTRRNKTKVIAGASAVIITGYLIYQERQNKLISSYIKALFSGSSANAAKELENIGDAVAQAAQAADLTPETAKDLSNSVTAAVSSLGEAVTEAAQEASLSNDLGGSAAEVISGLCDDIIHAAQGSDVTPEMAQIISDGAIEAASSLGETASVSSVISDSAAEVVGGFTVPEQF